MILNLYSIKDKLTEFQGVMAIRDDEIAERIFEGYCRKQEKENYVKPHYYEMYKLGSFNTETGEIQAKAKQEIELFKEGEQYEQNA